MGLKHADINTIIGGLKTKLREDGVYQTQIKTLSKAFIVEYTQTTSSQTSSSRQRPGGATQTQSEGTSRKS